MAQVSEIVVGWTPEESGRVSSLQVRSRIKGTSQWQEVASGIDPALGSLAFTSNAPGSEIEVELRFRMSTGVYSPWVGATVTAAGTKVDYASGVVNKPSKLEDINPSEGGKLTGIAPGADKTSEHTSRDTAAVGGRPSGTVISDIDKAKLDSGSALSKANTAVDDINTFNSTTLPQINSKIDAARADLEAETTRIDDKYAGEVVRLDGRITAASGGTSYDDAPIRAIIEDNRVVASNSDIAITNQQNTDRTEFRKNNTDTNARVTQEITTASQATGAVADRASALEAQLRGETDSNLRARINGHETVITNLPANYASATRAATLEAQMAVQTPSALNSKVDGVNQRITDQDSTLRARIEERAQAWASQEAGAVASTVTSLRTEYNGTKGEVTSLQGSYATLDGRTKAYIVQGAVAGANRAQISIFADSNGGAGVDIVGDTTFRGKLEVGTGQSGERVEITTSGMRVYDSNNVLRVTLGLF